MSSAAFSAAAALIRELNALGVEPTGVADDSRQVRPGDLFVAYPGDLADGRRFINEAIARGACAVLWQAGGDFVWNAGWKIANLCADGLRSLCGPLAHALFGQPSERLSLIAITGTNGKTTISQWLGRIYPQPCAIVGTLGAGMADHLIDTGLTTPEATTLTRYLAEFCQAGARACALEASSIGIEEGRLDGARVDVAVFTNLTRDHLDYHGTMEDYAAAKARLFTWPHLRLAVVNLDDPFGRELAALTTAAKVIGYTQSEQPSDHQGVITAQNVEQSLEGLRFRLCAPNGRASVETGLLGRYNVSNLLAVAAVLIDAGLTPGEVAERFAQLAPPAGRLEKIGGTDEPLIVVDYSHTPRCARQRFACLASAGQRARRAARRAVWLRRRSRPRQATADGRGRRATRRPRRAHFRQSARRGSFGDYRADPRCGAGGRGHRRAR